MRRVICYLKKWKNEAYTNAASDHEVPPSIGLTLLACTHFVPQVENEIDDDLLALQETASAIQSLFSYQVDENGNVVSADISCYLPVKPYTDVFSKMRAASTSYMLTFYKRFKKAAENLAVAVNSESEHDAGVYVQKVLGEEFEVPEKKSQNALAATAFVTKKEHSFG